jgi:hypothetical protein
MAAHHKVLNRLARLVQFASVRNCNCLARTVNADRLTAVPHLLLIWIICENFYADSMSKKFN